MPEGSEANNAVGRFYGKKVKTWDDLYLKLMQALKAKELIIDLKDSRKYKGDKSIKWMPKNFVIKIKESKTGANTDFIDAIRKGKYPGYAVRKHQSGEFPYSTRDRFSFNNLG